MIRQYYIKLKKLYVNLSFSVKYYQLYRQSNSQNITTELFLTSQSHLTEIIDLINSSFID